MHRIIIVFVVAAAVMLFAFASAEWYANESAVPRYCEDRQGVVERVELILTKSEPVGSGSKKPFIIAAKLIFLVPMDSGEAIKDYVERLTRHIDKVCNRL
jgi:hypothetical protein